MKVPRRRTLALNLALAAGSTLLALLALEAAARVYAWSLTGPPNSRRDPLLQHSPKYGWEKPPGERAWIQREEYGVALEINAKGLRGPDRPYAKPAGVCRVMLLGDSFVEGYAVAEEMSVRAQLEARLEAAGRRAEVINGGTHCWATDQELLFFRDEGRRHAPDIVVLFFYYNDVISNRPAPEKPYFELVDGALELRNTPVPPPPAAADRARSSQFHLMPIHGSVLLRLISNRTAAANLRLNHALADLGLAERSAPTDPPSEMWPYRTPADPEVGEAWRVTEALLAALKADVEGAGGRLVLFYVPARFEVNARAWALTRERYRMGHRWRTEAVVEHFRGVARELALPLVDPTDSLRAAEASWHPAYLPIDGHWQAVGHALAADALARVLLDAEPGCGVRSAGAP